jgi:FkbM family methyltransferase
VLRASELPLLTRVRLIWSRSKGRGLSRVDLGSGVYLELAEPSDWRAFRDVFVVEDYAGVRFDEATVLDAGAHKGYFAVYALAKGAKKVVSYEPDPENFAHLARLRGIDVRKAAISGDSGVGVLHKREAWSHSLVRHEGSRATEKVSVVSLDEALREIAPSGRVVLKLDIEGSECEALGSLAPGEWVALDEIVVEVHPWASCSVADLVSLLSRNGFVVAQRPAGGSMFILHAIRSALPSA